MARYSRAKGSVAVITLTNPPVNALSAAVRKGVADMVRRALADDQTQAVVLCGQNGTFCGGADIREFATPLSGPPLVPLIHGIEASEKPVVAAIEGVALGGGLELSLGCHYRIVHAKARLGLPEVTLGLIPGAGGTQRLPRLIGITAALELITTGRHVSAQEALKLGIVDQITNGNTLETAVEFALSVVGRPLTSRRLSARDPVSSVGVVQELEAGMARVKQRVRGAIAPVACVQALRAAATLPYSRGMQREAQIMTELMGSSQARALQYSFFAQRTAGKWSLPSGAQWNNTKARRVHKAGVVGLGTMGRGIAVSLVKAGVHVVAVEMEQEQLDVGRQAVLGMLEREAHRRGEAPPPSHLLTFTLSLEKLDEVELVIEAVFEDLPLKKHVFTQLSRVCKPDALLCTNTSGLDVDELAAVTDRRHLVVGMHFFAPANVMKLLEVIYGSYSSDEAVATAVSLGKRIGKVGVVVGNCPGFVGNRMLKLYMDQAYFLLEEGAEPEQVDQALEEFGFAMGIFKVSDLSGLDVGWRVRKASGIIGPDVDPETPLRRQGRRYSPLPDLLCEQGRLGQKSGRGWYRYDAPGAKDAKPDPEIRRFLEDYRRRHGLTARRIHAHEVVERCTYSLANEGFRILEEGVASTPEDIDTVYAFGYGWPRHRGGPMFHAAQEGLATVLTRLEHYHQHHPDVPHLQPSQLLRRLVEAGSPPITQWRAHVRQLQSHL